MYNNGPYNQGYGGQPPYPGAPPPGGYPGAPPNSGYPGAPPGGYPGAPPPGGYPGAPPPSGYPGGPQGYPSGPGFQPPPPQGGYGEAYAQPGEGTHLSSHLTGMYGTSYPDEEVKGFDFTDQSVRRGFIRKVYSILMIQLSISLAFICWFVYHRPTADYVHKTPALFIVALVVVFVTMIAMACCGELRRKTPTNFIFLLIFTIAESFLLAVSASTYKAEEVVMAVGITAAVCLGLTLFAFQTKWDFTMMGGILFVAVLILFIFGIVTIFVHSKVVKMVYASLGALIFSVYLIYDTQLMMGGNHKYSISPEEYIFAALNLYLDVVNIFIYILSIIGHSRD